MTNIKQSLLAALCTLVSISVANTTCAGSAEPRSIRAGAQACMLRRPEVVAQQAQPMSQQWPTRKAPINTPVLVDEPEAIILQVEPMSQQVPTMQAPVDEPVVAEEPALVAEPTVAEERAIVEPAVEEVEVLAKADGSELIAQEDNLLMPNQAE